MSGIVGLTGNHKKKINSLLETLSHRGPNNQETFSNDHVSLGQTRLSILDLTNAGNQPMFYIPDKGACSKNHLSENIKHAQLSIIYNGEIYNYKEVKSLLHGKGYKFSTECDTELILAAYSEWGTNFLERLNGMWAFCIYDQKSEALFLSRDRFGIKPLYYHYSEGEFIFASEMKPFYHSNIRKEINRKSLNHYYLFNTGHYEDTILNGVKKLPAGTNLIYDLKAKKIGLIEKYWHNKFTEDQIDEEKAKDKVINLLRDSVNKRMQSDVEIGAVLDGSHESSAIVMLMKEYSDKVKTFSVKFDNEDSGINTKEISDTLKTDHHELIIKAEDVKNLINNLPTYFDEPIGNKSLIASYFTSKLASEHVKVLLSHLGSHEFFAGNERYSDYFNFLSLKKLPKLIRSIKTSAYKKANKDQVVKLKQLMQTGNNKLLYLKIISDAFRNENETYYNLKDVSELYPLFGEQNGINALLSFDQHHYLFNNALVKEDRATMANSIEGRLPFLDHRLAEYANSLDPTLKMNNGSKNYILRESLKGLIPADIMIEGNKQPDVPLKHYLRKELKVYTKELIFDHLKYFPELSEEFVLQLWNQHQNEDYNYSAFFWNLIMLAKWYDSYIK